MSFQLENSHPQPKNYKPFVSTTNILGDDVLVSKGIPITLDLFGIKQSPPRIKFQHDRCPVFKQGTFLDSKVIHYYISSSYYVYIFFSNMFIFTSCLVYLFIYQSENFLIIEIKGDHL